MSVTLVTYGMAKSIISTTRWTPDQKMGEVFVLRAARENLVADDDEEGVTGF
jgi:hypothetical protein